MLQRRGLNAQVWGLRRGVRRAAVGALIGGRGGDVDHVVLVLVMLLLLLLLLQGAVAVRRVQWRRRQDGGRGRRRAQRCLAFEAFVSEGLFPTQG